MKENVFSNACQCCRKIQAAMCHQKKGLTGSSQWPTRMLAPVPRKLQATSNPLIKDVTVAADTLQKPLLLWCWAELLQSKQIAID